ncbi:dephospho-CoA kinase [Tenacibaculum agarivorans]|uniref:dephospho-CoA kinase n=1 Tax=Tenacibaculum agarivorans TaxID=1908389 RepID=UPI00094B8D80|nr:dephospho-CoA kinase [Tenacibaculum agarivorans]
MLIGITGGIGSGKTTVAKLFAAYKNVTVYYADLEAKKLMNTSEVIRKKLIREFGEKAYDTNGLNRAFLANIVFKDKEKLTNLNEIVHPEVYKHLTNFIEEHKDKEYILYENAILFENGSDKICDKIITVTAPHEVKIQRVIERDKTTREEVLHRMKNQWSDIKKKLQSHYVIVNENLNTVKENVKNIHNKLTEK